MNENELDKLERFANTPKENGRYPTDDEVERQQKTVAVNSIEIPAEYVELCKHWHSGQSDMLYAVASTGGLTLGKLRGYTFNIDEEGKEYCRAMTDEEQYRSLWSGLESDLYSAMKHDKESELTEFYAWVEKQIQGMGG